MHQKSYAVDQKDITHGVKKFGVVGAGSFYVVKLNIFVKDKWV